MGLLSQAGVAEEADYGDPTAPTRFLPFLSEGLGLNKIAIESDGLRAAGRELRTSAGRKVVGREAAGQMRFNLGPDDFGIFFLHALGAVNTTTPAGATIAREHLFTLGSLTGKSLTVQKGVEGDSEAVEPFNYLGCKVRSLTLTAEVDQYLVLTVALDARDEQGAATLPLSVAAYTESNLFGFEGVSLAAAAGASFDLATSFEMTIENPLTARQRTVFLGNGGLKGEPKSEGYPTVTGSIGTRFDTAAQVHQAFDQDTPLEVTFDALTGADVETDHAEQLTVNLGDVRLTGNSPQVSGPQVPDVAIPFQCYKPAGDSVSLLLRNGDAAP